MIVVAPQCHADTWYELLNELLAFIDFWRGKPFVDKRRVALSGISMGGYACWQVAMMRPDWFAAVAPVCGGGMYWNAARLKNLPIWAFHGEMDGTVHVDESRKMVEAVNKSGGSAKLTVYPGVQHDSWTLAFHENNCIYGCLIKNERILIVHFNIRNETIALTLQWKDEGFSDSGPKMGNSWKPISELSKQRLGRMTSI